MLGFLSPLFTPLAMALWLCALVPVVIHLLGRHKQLKVFFPSVLLIQKKLEQTTAKQRLKNILLLFCRTAFLLCLLFALLNPVWKQMTGTLQSGDIHPLVLRHNGAWSGMIHENGMSNYEHQTWLIKQLDSLSDKNCGIIDILPFESNREVSTAVNSSVHWLFGNYQQSMKQVDNFLRETGKEYTHLFLPVYSWADIMQIKDELIALCREYPFFTVVFIDYTFLYPSIDRLTRITPRFSSEKPLVFLECAIDFAMKQSDHALQVMAGNKIVYEKLIDQQKEGSSVYTMPLQIPSGNYLSGSIRLLSGAVSTPFTRNYFTFRNPGKVRLLHIGSEFISLPGLGKTSFYKEVIHLDRLTPELFNSTLKTYGGFKTFDLIYLSNTAFSSDQLFQELQEYVRDGGTLVVGTGEQSDISLLNRKLLVPFKLGYLGQRKESEKAGLSVGVSLAEHTHTYPVEVYKELIKNTTVKQQYAININEGAQIVLATANGPLLIEHKVKSGKLFLWTTDIDNPGWTSIGASGIIPLFHNQLFEGTRHTDHKKLNISSDSTFSLLSTMTEKDQNNGRHELTVLTPDKQPFSRIQKRHGYTEIGPFSKLGTYIILNKADTLSFSVNLAEKQMNGKKEDFFVGIDPKEKTLREQYLVVGAEDALKSLRSAFHSLWKLFIFGAVIFFLLEIVISQIFLAKTDNKLLRNIEK
ncbi:MAG: BatA domain-containing protein [Fibrobacteria bacterium]|nr:BatA domain-containing protein [Fibrobacteria bacterium]